MRTFIPKCKPLNTIRLLLYIIISYLILDTFKDKLMDKENTKTGIMFRKRAPQVAGKEKGLIPREAEPEVPATTVMYDYTTKNERSRSDFEMVDGKGINNVVAWRELKESTDYILASQYIHIGSVFGMPKFRYLKNYKSPCWHEKLAEEAVGTIRCFPYVFLAGVEKCGTTDLYDSLKLHDMVETGIVKEPHYWSKRRFKKKPGMASYLSNFYSPSKAIHRYMQKNQTEYYHPKITIDGSADTFLFNYIWKTFGDQMLDPGFVRRVLTPHHLHHILPNSKFLIILRNPIDRLYSSYNFFPMLIRNPQLYKNISRKEMAKEMYEAKSPENFHNNVVDALRWFEKCINQYPKSQKCFFWNKGEELIDNFVNHMQMGFYGVTLKLWLEVFQREQFKIIRLEDYSMDTIPVLNDVLNFLGLNTMTPLMIQQIEERNISNYGKRRKSHGPMLPDTRQLLLEFYKPYNQMLADILEDSKFMYAS